MSIRQRWARHLLRRSGRGLAALALAIALAGALALSGCSASGPSKEELAAAQQKAELAKQREEEARRLEQQRKAAEAKREREAVKTAVAAEGAPPILEPLDITAAPTTPPAPAAAGTAAAGAGTMGPAAAAPAAPATSMAAPVALIPFEQAVPSLPPEPTVRVAVLSHQGALARGQHVALALGTYDRAWLEERLGMAVKIQYVAESRLPLHHASEIHYRPEFFRAAQSLAYALSSQQTLGPMSPAERAQSDVDVVVHIGPAYR